ncbi:MAG: hypothetical protein JWM27_1160 [Gemmatimonadetes bacterium]|nr:hypothetical protein [Gemmatimonadota bacterium]
MPATPRSDVQVREAEVTVLRIFDVADGIDLVGVERALTGRGTVARIRLSRVEPKAIAFGDPPVVTDLMAPALEIGGTRVATRASARIHSFGVVSLSVDLVLPAPMPWAAFERFAREAEREAAGLSFWRVSLDALLEQIRPAMDRPSAVRMEEDYAVVTVRALDGCRATDLPRAVDLVPLLTHETRALGEAARRDVLKHAYSYYEDDLAVLTWDRALVVEPSPDDDLTDILEVANAQLLELRYYDALLDAELPRIYTQAAHARHNAWVLRGRYSRAANQMRALVAEVVQITEKVDNAIKVTDDVYLARVYGAALELFRVRFWTDAIDRKLALIRDTYTALYDEAVATRAEWLEVAILLLIVLETVVAVVRH